LVIAGITVDAAYRTMARGRKYQNDAHWCLTTKRGHVIAKFPSEEALERWWADFQRGQSREPAPLVEGRYVAPTRERHFAPPRDQGGRVKYLPQRSPGEYSSYPSNGGAVDPLKPWSNEFDMPEFDAE
jgi:hypothetical protein